ncbi:MAG TPA: 50S ribosomal protein L23 [Gammaproteobacteria bacterium]|nr:50S ribosomal protein L23 [Gammaproteobacteria bacterium]
MNKVRLSNILLAPHVSEKATIAADVHKQFVFRVVPDATKPEIRRAVEQMFDVEVAQVRVCNIKGKRKRFGQVNGRRKTVRKAYVTLKEGFDIEFAGAAA